MNKLKAQVEARLCLKDALRTRLSDPQIQAVNNQTRQKALKRSVPLPGPPPAGGA